jgi:MFS family permease
MARLLVDVTPLRNNRQFRLLWGGQLVSFLGTQLTVVGVPYQVYRLTHSTLQVGLVSLAGLLPLLVGSLAGGAIIDAFDRRRVMLLAQLLLAVTGVGLVVNAASDHPAVWPLYVVTSVAALLSGVDRPARTAVIPMLVERDELTSAFALWQILIQLGTVVGPAIAGLLIAQAGLATVYGIDAVTFLFGIMATLALRPLPPAGDGTPAGWSSIVEGLRYLKADRLLTSTFVIDLDAMIFGLPRAVFPALALGLYQGGAATVGLMFAAPGAGALLGALLTGPIHRVRRQGRAVIVCVVVWGAAMVGLGVVPVLWVGLVFLGVAGAADVVSAVFRSTILQSTVPDELRGRLSATFIAVVTGGPRLGDAEAGAAAAIGGSQFAVWSGGAACILGAAVVAWRLPELLAYDHRVSGDLLAGVAAAESAEIDEAPDDRQRTEAGQADGGDPPGTG